MAGQQLLGDAIVAFEGCGREGRHSGSARKIGAGISAEQQAYGCRSLALCREVEGSGAGDVPRVDFCTLGKE
jgi:hypothetical protein